MPITRQSLVIVYSILIAFFQSCLSPSRSIHILGLNETRAFADQPIMSGLLRWVLARKAALLP